MHSIIPSAVPDIYSVDCRLYTTRRAIFHLESAVSVAVAVAGFVGSQLWLVASTLLLVSDI